MQYVVAGKLTAKPSTDLDERIRFTGGWKERTINGATVLWNACVSPGFAQGDTYEFLMN